MTIEFFNKIGARFLDYFFTVSVNGSLFWLVIAGLAWLFRKKSATFLHALWFLALVAFLIPPLPNFFSVPVKQRVGTIILAPVYAAASGQGSGAVISWHGLILLFWLILVALLLAIFIGQSYRFFLLLKEAHPFKSGQKQRFESPKRVGFWQPKIYLSSQIGMPLTIGTFLPKIFLPAEAENWNKKELDFVLKHEFAHIQRGDLLLMKFQAIVQILFFFHPLVWITNSLVNYYRELACDDYSISKSGGQVVEYSKLILKIIDRARKFQYACLLSNCFGKNKTLLTRRFKHILKQKEEIMLKLTRFEKLIVAGLAVLAIAIACEEKATQPAQKAEVATLTGSGDSAENFVAYDTPPKPIGGFKAIQLNLKYPESARKAGIEGKVYIKAAINENGDVFETEIIKSLDKACDEAAIEAIKQVKWEPAKKDGKPVKVWISIPIIFKLSDSDSKESSVTDKNTSDNGYVKFDTAPKPIGGFKAIQSSLKYPESARKAGIEGRVFVKVEIDENGNVLQTEILKSLDEACDAAAIEAVKKTNWEPAKSEGNPVKAWISIPIIFKLS